MCIRVYTLYVMHATRAILLKTRLTTPLFRAARAKSPNQGVLFMTKFHHTHTHILPFTIAYCTSQHHILNMSNASNQHQHRHQRSSHRSAQIVIITHIDTYYKFASFCGAEAIARWVCVLMRMTKMRLCQRNGVCCIYICCIFVDS